MQRQNMTIIEHLEELRRVLIISLISLVPASVIGWFLRERILKIILKPALDQKVKLIYLTPAEPFFVAIKMAIFTGFIIALPIILWQFWSFLLPALRQKERRLIIILVPLSLILFIVGVVFGYLTVFTFGVTFFINFGQTQLIPNLEPTFKLNDFLSFAVSFLLPFGVIFELPLVIGVLARLGIVTSRFLASKRKYAVLVIAVVAAVVTPTPDAFTMTLSALPMYLLYEVSILLAYLIGRKRKKEQMEQEREMQES